MKIEIHNTSVYAEITIGDNADTYDCIDAFIGAMITCGYGVEAVLESFKRRAKDMEGIGDEV